MPAVDFTESVVEEAALQWFAEIGYDIGHGPDLEPGGSIQARVTLQDVILRPRLLDALRKINPGVPDVALEEAIRRVEGVGQPSLVLTNREFHLMLVNGLSVDVMTHDCLRGERVVLVDFDDPDANEFLAVNQVTVKGTHTRRPDIVVFVNGLPLAVIELMNIADEKTTIEQAYHQLQTFKAQIPALFHTNELLVISDGVLTEAGTITSPRGRFAAWKTIDGETLDHNGALEMAQIIEALIELAKEFREDANRGEELELKTDEYAFYEALALSESAKAVMGDDQLLTIAREVADSVRKNATIDWRQREQVRAKLRVAVRRVLNRHDYPPENRDEAVQLIIEQAGLLASDLAA